MIGYAALDLETTGLDFKKDEIIEISIIMFNKKGEIEDIFTSLINPEISIPKEATRINGIDDKMVATAPTFNDLATEIKNKIENRVIVGHNVIKFDIKFLEEKYEKNNDSIFIEEILDTFEISKIMLPENISHKLENLCKYFGIYNEKNHRAEADALSSWKLLLALVSIDKDDTLGLANYNLPKLNSNKKPDVLLEKSTIRDDYNFDTKNKDKLDTNNIKIKNGFNLLSNITLVLGVFWFFWIGSLIAVVFGHLLAKSRKFYNTKIGKKRSILGMIFGYLYFIILVIILFTN